MEITLDCTLTFKKHLDKTGKKLWSRGNLIQKLIRTGWSADTKALRIAALKLTYSIAEYYGQVWCNSEHVKKIDTKLYIEMRSISGTVKLTPSINQYSNIRFTKEGKTNKRLKRQKTIIVHY